MIFIHLSDFCRKTHHPFIERNKSSSWFAAHTEISATNKNITTSLRYSLILEDQPGNVIKLNKNTVRAIGKVGCSTHTHPNPIENVHTRPGNRKKSHKGYLQLETKKHLNI